MDLLLMRLWLVCCLLAVNLAYSQNSATQFLNLTITFTNKNVTLTAYQQNNYANYAVDTAYILVPTQTITKTIEDVYTATKVDLDFLIQVLPVQQTPQTYQLQATTLAQRFNLLGFLSPFYFAKQFYPPAVQGLANPLYCYTSLQHAAKELKLWYIGQTTIGGQQDAVQTVSILLGKDYKNYNLLESSTPSAAIASFPLRLRLTSQAIKYLSTQAPGTYFLQIYLTLNPYQEVETATLQSFLIATQNFLNVLYGQTFSYGNLANAQVLANRAFLLNEIEEIQTELDSL